MKKLVGAPTGRSLRPTGRRRTGGDVTSHTHVAAVRRLGRPIGVRCKYKVIIYKKIAGRDSWESNTALQTCASTLLATRMEAPNSQNYRRNLQELKKV